MPTKQKQKPEKPVIWPAALLAAAENNPPKITTADLEEAIDVDAPSACQVLRRLQSWGLLRVVGFEAARTNPKNHGGGRRRKVYELTPAGERKVDRIRRANQ